MPEYIKAAFDNEIPFWLRKDKEALRALNRNGIDLKKAEYSINKTGKAADDFAVYCLQPYEGHSKLIVWIPGIYNDDEYLDDPYDDKYKAIKYISKKNLPIRDVVYINKKSNAKEWRDKYRDPRYTYPDNRHGRYAGQYYTPPRTNWRGEETPGEWSETGERVRYGEYRDKSGYIIPDPKDKLLEFYSSDKGYTRIKKRLEQVYADLIQLRKDLFDVDFMSFGEYEGSTDYMNMLNRFGDVCRDYRLCIKRLQEFENLPDTEKQYGRYSIESVFDDLRSMLDDIKRIRKAIESGRY